MAIAIAAPAVEVVAIIAERLNVGVELVDAGKRASFARMDRVGGAASGDFAFAVANGHHGGIAGFINVDFVVAGTKDGESEVGCIDLEGFVLFETPHAHA